MSKIRVSSNNMNLIIALIFAIYFSSNSAWAQIADEQKIISYVNNFFSTDEAKESLGHRSRLLLKEQLSIEPDSMLLKAESIDPRCRSAIARKRFSPGRWSENVSKNFSLVDQVKINDAPLVKFSEVIPLDKDVYCGFVLISHPGKGEKILYYECKVGDGVDEKTIKCIVVMTAIYRE